MKIIFDLDYTLLDTKKFKDKLAEIFDKEDFVADYKKYFRDKNINFNFETYLDLLVSRKRIDRPRTEELKLKLKKLMGQLDNYLFSGAEDILKQFKGAGTELILITFGDKKWQAEKVKNLSIQKYFDRIVFEYRDKSKSKSLNSLKDCREEIFIVNDNAREAREMTEIIGGRAKVFLVDGPYAKNIKHNWPINKLSEITI